MALETVDWLAQHFPGVVSEPVVTPLPRLALQLPPPDPSKLQRVRDFLVQQRALAPALLEPLIQSGTLYADARANAVFLLLGKENLPVGAELRGTTARHWRGLASGSQRDLCCFAVPIPLSANLQNAANPIILCESAIDALSCFALHPHCRCRLKRRSLVPGFADFFETFSYLFVFHRYGGHDR